MNTQTGNFRLYFLILHNGKLPITFCYALSVADAKKFFKTELGYIVTYEVLDRKIKRWTDAELATCPLYERGKTEGFTLENWRDSRSLIPIALRLPV